MDPREDARRTSAPPAFDRFRRPPDAYSWLVASDEPPTLSDEDERRIGVSDLPPWELAGATNRPPALPAQQPAPWRAGMRPSPQSRPARAADIDADPYDAFAPLAEDFAFERDRLAPERRVTKSFTTTQVVGPRLPTDPVAWPPVPTEFRPNAPASRPNLAPSASDWPPVPADPFPLPAPKSERVRAPADGRPSLWDAPADRPAAARPSVTTGDESDQWVLSALDVDDRATAAATNAPPAPSSPALAAAEPAAVENPPGTLFARYEAALERAGGALGLAAADAVAEDIADESAAAGPSSLQTALATLLVALVVIGLVIAFLFLFTSLFR